MADVLLVTTWKTACGIAEHSAELKDAVETQSNLTIEPGPEMLDPFTRDWTALPRIIHLNYHAALHSQWTPALVEQVRAVGKKVVVTFHDTGVPNSDLAKALHDVCDAMIVHEPADDLPKALYWRMGVADAPRGGMRFGTRVPFSLDPDFDHAIHFKAYDVQPVLGSIGFPFPWKNYDELAKLTAELGWALLLIAPNATDTQVKTWRALNPNSWIRTDFVPRYEALQILAGCDATAFCYVCHNTGQSAAILQGIAARKPVLALATCRQFRSLFNDPLGRTTIHWVETFEDMKFSLSHFVRIERVAPQIVALAEQESWRHVGQKYIDLYRSLL